MAEDIRKMTNPEGIVEFERGYVVPDCVVLDSAYCSMGRMVALRACDAAGWTMHDSNTLLALVPECGVTMDDVEVFENEATAEGADLAALRESDEYKRISGAFRLAAERALNQGPCLIHDRVTKAFVESLGKTCVSAMTYASDRSAMRVRAQYSPVYAHLTDTDELDAAIAHEDARRRTWHALGGDDTRWGDPATYDLMLSTDTIGRDFAAELLARLMQG